MRTKQQRWRTAVHEAAHAVIALHEGRSFRDVVIEVAGRSNGMVRDLLIDPNDDDHVRILLAGSIAHRLRVRQWHGRIFEAADDDLNAVAGHFRVMERARALPLLTWNVDRTRDELVERWGAVERVAEALATERRLTVDQVSRLVDRRRARKLSPPGRVPDGSWGRLIDHVLWRVDNPGSLRDAREAIFARLLAGDRVAS